MEKAPDLPKKEALELLVAALKANLLGKTYDDETGFFGDFDVDRFDHAGHMLFSNAKGAAKEKFKKLGDGNFVKTWYSVYIKKDKRPVAMAVNKALKEANSTFFMAAVQIVLTQLNTEHPDNGFRKMYLKQKDLPSDTRFVYNFSDKFEVLPNSLSSEKFDKSFRVVTSDQAKKEHDVGKKYASIVKKVEAGRDLDRKSDAWREEVQKEVAAQNVTIYMELKNKVKIGDIAGPASHLFFITNRPDVVSDLQAAASSAYGNTLKDFEGKKYYTARVSEEVEEEEEDIEEEAEEIPVEEDVPLTADQEEEEKLKEQLAEETADSVYAFVESYYLDKKRGPQHRTKLLALLNAAAGLTSQKTKKGGDVLNLTTIRQVKQNNNDSSTIIGTVPGGTLYPGRLVKLAVNAKSDRISWISISNIGTNRNKTSRNKDFTNWIQDMVFPLIWSKITALVAEDIHETSTVTAEEAMGENVEERMKDVGGAGGEQEDETEEETTFGKVFASESEIGFTTRWAAFLPPLPENVDMSKLGGDISKIKKHVDAVNAASMSLAQGEASRLELIQKGVADLFKPDDSSVIQMIRNNLRAGESNYVVPDSGPFHFERAEDAGNPEDFQVDFRLRKDVKAEMPADVEEESDE
jgi:hypothetical protein